MKPCVEGKHFKGLIVMPLHHWRNDGAGTQHDLYFWQRKEKNTARRTVIWSPVISIPAASLTRVTQLTDKYKQWSSANS